MKNERAHQKTVQAPPRSPSHAGSSRRRSRRTRSARSRARRSRSRRTRTSSVDRARSTSPPTCSIWGCGRRGARACPAPTSPRFSPDPCPYPNFPTMTRARTALVSAAHRRVRARGESARGASARTRARAHRARALSSLLLSLRGRLLGGSRPRNSSPPARASTPSERPPRARARQSRPPRDRARGERRCGVGVVCFHDVVVGVCRRAACESWGSPS